MTDDQDYLLNSTHRAYMPKLNALLGDRGLHLPNFLVSSSLCCPSRVSLLTGRFTHNHNLTSNQAPQGGFRRFTQLRLDRDWLPGWLQALGYRTMLTGKFMNLFDVAPGDTARCPRGWDLFDPLTDATVYQYVNFDFMPQCQRLDRFRGAYQTDVLADRAAAYISAAAKGGAPFYLQVNPAACHTSCDKGSEEAGPCRPPVPSPKYAGRWSGLRVPRLPNWNVSLPPALGARPGTFTARSVDGHYQRRIEALMSVDDLVETVVNALERAGVLGSTYVIFTSDNGYHLGNHAQAKGKTLPYEEDVRVPFFMRGPGVPYGVVHPYMATMVDVTATLVALAGGAPPTRCDGVPLPLDRFAAAAGGTGSSGNGTAVGRAAGTGPAAAAGPPAAVEQRPPSPTQATPALPQYYPSANGTLRQMVPLEMWIRSWDKDFDRKDYRSIRLCANDSAAPGGGGAPAAAERCWKYTVWCVSTKSPNFRELYDINADPGEINNLMDQADPGGSAGAERRRLVSRLDALLQVMGYCKGEGCRTPWARLHPGGDVTSFEQAMAPQHDAQYRAYSAFAWRACQPYYDPVNNEFGDRGLGALTRWNS
ncbi:hypothetical protein HYH03_007734 [Edaphochlamys debaryana]|uniref:Sulfatase N-terminal domain-containing protein n=1 Tax=Edaphochlamys debaryana TaxID=47281 RepID=A0A836BYY6_9CHLO|nr:hypothetical protein HYH03_007734 [Edaphochlamys debaryana]|eukprot:KAG2494095.1 hypothetical protein HYH03_007734 [Edaphochlamys debaryana]